MLRPSDDQDEPFVPDLSEGTESGLYLALLELLDEGLIIAGDDHILEANSAACRLLERSYGELVGHPLSDLFPTEQAFLAARERLFIQGQMRGSLQLALPGGRRRDMRFCAAARLRPGIHALVLSPDSSAGADPPPRSADTLWPRLAAALEQPVIVVDGDQRVAAANAAALRRLKVARAGLVGQRLDQRLAVRWPDPGDPPLAHIGTAGGGELAARIVPGPKPGWQLLILPAEPLPPGGGPALRSRSATRGKPQPAPNPLSGLPSPRQLGEYFLEAVARASRQHSQLAILNIHTDQLRTINARHGHDLGDRLLQHLALRLRAALPPAATLARQRGDTFIALIPDVDHPSQVEAATRELEAALARPVTLDGLAIPLATSIGVVLFPTDGNGLETLLRHAEVAREQARRSGVGVHFYADELNNQGLQRRALEASLCHAIERQQMEVHFAPEWRGGEPPAARTLLRWRHPDLGLVSGRRLLPLLRHSRLVADFGAWTLRQACASAAGWAARGRSVPLVVGVALEQLADPALPTLLRQVLADTGLPPGQLELDLEESLLAQGDETHLAVARELATQGIALAIDDFGQGLSSLPRLAALPLSTLRLSPELVHAGLAGGPQAGLLPALLAMARPLGLRLVAKGVDDAGQRTQLETLGFTALQGRHFGAPADAAGFARAHLGLG